MGTKVLWMSSDLLHKLASAFVSIYRRSGADVPFGDPLPSHGTEMEGWFWRLTDPAQGRVVVALCSENRHPEGNWSTAAIALHPGGIVRSAAIDGVRADRTRFSVQADSGGDLIDAGRERLRRVLGDTEVDLQARWSRAQRIGAELKSI